MKTKFHSTCNFIQFSVVHDGEIKTFFSIASSVNSGHDDDIFFIPIQTLFIISRNADSCVSGFELFTKKKRTHARKILIDFQLLEASERARTRKTDLLLWESWRRWMRSHCAIAKILSRIENSRGQLNRRLVRLARGRNSPRFSFSYIQ